MTRTDMALGGAAAAGLLVLAGALGAQAWRAHEARAAAAEAERAWIAAQPRRMAPGRPYYSYGAATPAPAGASD